jgi:hypothetical protein
MMKSLLAGVAAIAMVASAAAQTMDDTENNSAKTNEVWFECSVTKSDRDPDPVYKINVAFQNDEFTRVIHTTRSGKVYNRASQYDVIRNDHTAQGANLWFGQNLKNKNLFMSGTLGVINGKLYYKEWRPTPNNVTPTLVVESVCHRA